MSPKRYAEVSLTDPRTWASFLRAGGALTVDDWTDDGMAPETRAAMEEAGNTVAAERADMVAEAILSRLDELGDDAAARGAIDRGLAAVKSSGGAGPG